MFIVKILDTTITKLCVTKNSVYKIMLTVLARAVQWLSWLVTGLCLKRPTFEPVPVHEGFVVVEVVVGKVLLVIFICP